jgi:hypothetical protein
MDIIFISNPINYFQGTKEAFPKISVREYILSGAIEIRFQIFI